jgi:hypothetical protein
MAHSGAECELLWYVERAADLEPRCLLTMSALVWDISTIPKGSIFDIACAWLPDHDLSGLGKEYGLDLSHEAPICQKDASGKYNTPLPDPPTVE